MTPEERALLKEHMYKMTEPWVDRSSGYPLVSRDEALDFLGCDDVWFSEFLTGDTIRSRAPKGMEGKWFYHWNVVDAKLDCLGKTEEGQELAKHILEAIKVKQ